MVFPVASCYGLRNSLIFSVLDFFLLGWYVEIREGIYTLNFIGRWTAMVFLCTVDGIPHKKDSRPWSARQEYWCLMIIQILTVLVLAGTGLSFHAFEAVRLAIGSGGLIVIAFAVVPVMGFAMALVKTVFWLYNRKSREKGRS